MNHNPLVSVVIPSYNRADDLKRAVQSVITQTYQNWEIIIVDNSSTDHNVQVVESFSDNRIRLLNIQNGGVIAKSRNLGIQSAKGDWIALLDSDDWWKSSKIKILQNGNGIINSSVMFKKTLLDEIGFLDESKELIAWEDFDFWLRIAKANKIFHRVSDCLGYYWAGGGNVSNDQKTLLILDEIQKKYFLEINNLNPWWISYTKAKIYYKLKNQELAKLELSKSKPIYWKDKLKSWIWKMIISFSI